MVAPWHFSLVLCLALVAGVTASMSQAAFVDAMPECGLNCLLTAAEGSPCSLTNTACLCRDEELRMRATSCVERTCNIAEALTTQNLTSIHCDRPIRDRSGPYVTQCNIILTIAFVCIAQRLIFKRYIGQCYGLDDLFIFLTLFVGVAVVVIDRLGLIANGLGRDTWTLPFKSLTEFGRYFFFVKILYFVQVTLLKTSILFFYLRIFVGKGVRWLLWGTVVFNALFGLAFCIVVVFQCHPLPYFWQRLDPNQKGTCLNILAINWSNAAISIALDLWMLSIPLYQLKHLQMQWRQKISIAIMFGVGSLFTAISIIRLVLFVEYGWTYNPTWQYIDTNWWSFAELSVGAICACMPSLRHLFVACFSRISTAAKNHSNDSTAGSDGAWESRRPLGIRRLDASRFSAFYRVGTPEFVTKPLESAREATFDDWFSDEVGLVYVNDAVHCEVCSEEEREVTS